MEHGHLKPTSLFPTRRGTTAAQPRWLLPLRCDPEIGFSPSRRPGQAVLTDQGAAPSRCKASVLAEVRLVYPRTGNEELVGKRNATLQRAGRPGGGTPALGSSPVPAKQGERESLRRRNHLSRPPSGLRERRIVSPTRRGLHSGEYSRWVPCRSRGGARAKLCELPDLRRSTRCTVPRETLRQLARSRHRTARHPRAFQSPSHPT